jgi:thiol-disulfide isomerase/thioredoxin
VKAKTIILAAFVIAAVLGVIVGCKKQEAKPSGSFVGIEAPELAVGDPNGKTVRLSELKDTVVFVNFWATWCPPCREEMPSIQALHNKFKDQKDFRMITILYRDKYDNAMAYMKDNKYDFPVVVDIDEKTAKSYGVTGVPETYIVDKKGILREKMIGPFDWASPQAVDRISDLMKQ